MKNCPERRPCPYVSCRYHLYLDIDMNGKIIYNFPNIEPHEMTVSCLFDLNIQKCLTAIEIGEIFGISKQRVLQIEERAIKNLSILLKNSLYFNELKGLNEDNNE